RGADSWEVWLEKGLAHADQQQWDQAAAGFAGAVERGASSDRVLSQHALLRLAVGDIKGYRKACAAMLEIFAATETPKIANNVAWVCAYAPVAVADPDQAVRLAEKVALSHPKKYATLNTLGAILYRAGKCEAAIQNLTEARKAHPRGGAPFDY